MTPELRVLIGIPGSGKSTIAQQWLKAHEVDHVLSSDAIRREVTGVEDSFIHEPLVWSIYYERLDHLLRQGVSVALDSTNLKPEYRGRIFAIVQRVNPPHRIIAYRVHIPFDTANDRNLSRHKEAKGYGSPRMRPVPYDRMVEMRLDWITGANLTVLSEDGFDEILEVESSLTGNPTPARLGISRR